MPPHDITFFLPCKCLQGRLEWESDSGRQLTIGDVAVNELSKVEIQAMQRLAINTLQSMDIPVSHGLLKGLCTIHCTHMVVTA